MHSWTRRPPTPPPPSYQRILVVIIGGQPIRAAQRLTLDCLPPRRYFSAQGLRYHLLHHHPERAHKGRAAADGGGATRRKRSVSTADSADDDLSNARSKARALDAHEGDASSAMSYSDAARSVCGSAELPALTADKNRLASAVREVVMEKMSEVHGDIGLLRRLDETQQVRAHSGWCVCACVCVCLRGLSVLAGVIIAFARAKLVEHAQPKCSHSVELSRPRQLLSSSSK